MLSTSGVLCNFSGMLQDFPGFSDVGMGKERKRAERYGEKKKSNVSIHHGTISICDKKLLQLRYKPDVWAKHSADITGIY